MHPIALGHRVNLIDQGQGGHLMRHGDGKSAIAEGAGTRHGRGQIIGNDVVRNIDVGQAHVLESGVVDGRPQRMTSGQPEQGAHGKAGVYPGHGGSE